MSKLAVSALALACIALVGTTPMAGEKAWFDIDNCVMCKNLGAEKGLMDHITWETHKIKNGMLSVARVDADYQEAFRRAHANMEKAAEAMQAGGPAEMCGFCMSYGKLMMSGATAEQIDSEAGHIGLITASDPAVVKAIHQHAQRTIDEYEKWLAERGS